MNLFTKLVISLITAGLAAAAITQLNLATNLQVWLAIAAATVSTILLSQIKLSKPAASGSRRGDASRADSPPPEEHKPRKRSGKREEGEVKWFNVSKGFGFIVRENGDEIFVHFRSIRGDDGERRSLRDGQRVSFELAESDKGPQAEDVEPL